MQHAIINAMKCMRAIKDRIARPVYQLAIISVSLYTRTVYQPGKSSVRDLRSPLAHHSSVVDTRIRHGNTNSANQLSPDILNHGRNCPEPQIQQLELAEELSGSTEQVTGIPAPPQIIDGERQQSAGIKSRTEMGSLYLPVRSSELCVPELLLIFDLAGFRSGCSGLLLLKV
ncbi:hypothetical protein F511_18444 [Dorcoceras hygrometricum]|uniref:Uncharacterized protein n=1 Tax=Dorcoceras hygrometricum TaxID=472368 RepID=A0A2Z7B401_9LAMI|nr:hypothetical protein F511_18444 [Dorcoceras hygrometricum]